MFIYKYNKHDEELSAAQCVRARCGKKEAPLFEMKCHNTNNHTQRTHNTSVCVLCALHDMRSCETAFLLLCAYKYGELYSNVYKRESSEHEPLFE